VKLGFPALNLQVITASPRALKRISLPLCVPLSFDSGSLDELPQPSMSMNNAADKHQGNDL
jgi:hypothetical protein